MSGWWVGLRVCGCCRTGERILDEAFRDLMGAHPVKRIVRIVYAYGDVVCRGK